MSRIVELFRFNCSIKISDRRNLTLCKEVLIGLFFSENFYNGLTLRIVCYSVNRIVVVFSEQLSLVRPVERFSEYILCTFSLIFLKPCRHLGLELFSSANVALLQKILENVSHLASPC